MRRPILLLCVVFVVFAGVWFSAPAASAEDALTVVNSEDDSDDE